MEIIDAGAIELAGEPELAVHADHDLKWEPRLQPQVHQPELGVLEVEVVMETFSGFKFELEPMRFAVAADEVGQAWLHAVEHADEPFANPVAFGKLAGQRLLALGGRVKVTHRSASAFGEGMRGIAHAVAEAGGVRAKVLQQNAYVAEVPEQKGRLIKVAQAASQPQSVVTADYARDIRAVLRQKTLHAATVMNRRIFFHPPTLSPRPHRLQFWLRRQPR